MKNITVSVDDETHRIAQLRAAEMDTSVSDLVREYLRTLADERDAVSETERDRRRQLMNQVIENIAATRPNFSASDNLTREELYDRAAARAEAEKAKRERR